MNNKYYSLLLVLCVVLLSMAISTGCASTKSGNIVIKHKSRFAQSASSKASSQVINLSDGKKVNYDFRVGPGEVSGPSFNVVNVGGP